ncbi:putative sodium-coupled neutral amino acid transporter 11 [Diaphorina citri]|uniref:Putative sodium-coupled neutral amino acid transporter 11 n=1 Tax=Diaphorina citri TaxID=121845 RepID=A0A3Q0IV66_DIACI|nr:putative sodium-coupled neutral amino acid transporter 11 [Diaphorina citri]
MNPCGSVHSGLGLGSKDGPEKSRTGFYFASFNYVNSILGSGVIGIPYALSKAGFGLGLFLLLVVAVVTDYSLILMVRSGHLSGTYSYQGIMEASFGYPGYVVLSLMQFVYPFIAMVSYNIVVGDTITKVSVRLFSLKATSLFARRDFVVGLATLFITIPLCLFRDLAKLARWSLASLVLVLFILMCILIRLGTIEETVPETEDAWAFADTGMVPAIGIMAFAFMCHHNVFLLYESIEGASQFVWDKLTHISVAVAFVVSLLFGIAGYATFTGNVQGDLLENYCWYDDLMNLARLAFSFKSNMSLHQLLSSIYLSN